MDVIDRMCISNSMGIINRRQERVRMLMILETDETFAENLRESSMARQHDHIIIIKISE